MMVYDRAPVANRKPIEIAGDLVRRGGKLRVEAANCMKRMIDEAAAHAAERLRWEEQIIQLRNERRVLAMLAADKPMFDNPLTIYAAQELRDRVLSSAAEAGGEE